MLEEKRKFRRFDIPLIMEFKPTRGKCSWGLTRNFSYEGFSLESQNLDFEPKENLEFKLKFPQNGTFVSVLGDVVWKRQVENRCLAGVKLREMDKKVKSEIFKKICDYGDYGNVSPDSIFYGQRPESVFFSQRPDSIFYGRRPDSVLSSRGKSVKKFLKKLLMKSKNIGIQKQYLRSKSLCKVTFRLPKEAAQEARRVTIVGEFNNWNTTEAPMKKLKNGNFTVTLELPSNREYRFRYLLDGNRWENDWSADKYLPNSYGCDDSVVVI